MIGEVILQDSTGIFSTFDFNGWSQPSGGCSELGLLPAGDFGG
jgi:hypothetical protein